MGKWTHGLRKIPEYMILNGIKVRCYNPKRVKFKDYGGRGITVCDRWRHGEGGKAAIECFIADMGRRPSPIHSVERIDNDGPYDPSNCRWATPREQSCNSRRNYFIDVDGCRELASDVALRNGIAATTFAARMRRGWSVQDAVSVKAQPGNRYMNIVAS